MKLVSQHNRRHLCGWSINLTRNSCWCQVSHGINPPISMMNAYYEASRGRRAIYLMGHIFPGRSSPSYQYSNHYCKESNSILSQVSHFFQTKFLRPSVGCIYLTGGLGQSVNLRSNVIIKIYGFCRHSNCFFPINLF